MQILDTEEKIDGQSVLTIGVFDGVHIGHHKLLSQVSEISQQKLTRTVVTFDCHPLSIIAPERVPKTLTPLDLKLKLLEDTGLVDAVLVIKFNPVRAAQSAEDFVRETLVEQLNAAHVVIGENFVFGHERRGNLELLKSLGQEYSFDVDAVELLEANTEHKASSTLIRQYISVGDVAKAKNLLGRPHRIQGKVEGGDKIGTDLGYPTANTRVDDSIAVPSDGVYAGRVMLGDGSMHKSAISIGVRPMFHEDNIRVIEPHLLDFNENIYGQEIIIEFENKLRDQQVFDTVDALVAQIDKDIESVRGSVSL